MESKPAKQLTANRCLKHRDIPKEYVCTKCKTIYCQICLQEDASHSKFDRLPKKLLSNYEFEQFLGKGSFGSVFKVTSLSDGSPYAIKVIDVDKNQGIEPEKELDALSKETKIHVQISHPNVIKYFHSTCDPEEGIFVIVLELADYSLKSKIPTLTQDEAFDYFIEIIEALFYLHLDKRIVHRDLKPDNILLKNYKIKLADLGSAKLMNYTKSTGVFTATPEYLPPEVLNFSKRPFESSDIWASGIVFHEMLTNGKHPFDPHNTKDRDQIKVNILKGNRVFDKSIQDQKYLKILESTQYL